MTRYRETLLIAATIAGCGSVSSPSHPGEPVMVVTAKLATTPPLDVDASKLRATLVWTNGLGLESLLPLDCQPTSEQEARACQRDLLGDVAVSASDVQVTMDFPLQVRLELFELPTPIRGKVEKDWGWGGVEKGIYYSVPEGELVLYEDGNGNGRFDFLPLGEPGPGPDRVVALSSGRNAEGKAVRTSVVYKAGRVLPIQGYDALLTEHNYDPQTMLASSDGPNGVFALRQVVDGQALVEEALLSAHSLVYPSTEAYLASQVPATVTPIAEATLELFTVDPDRRSWLARGCERLPPRDVFGISNSPPPAGADIQCGSYGLLFASHPDNYCGQIDQRLAYDENFKPSRPSSWPCDEHGFKEGTPYRATTERLDAEWLEGEMMEATGTGYGDYDLDFQCQPGVFYHFGDVVWTRMPTVAPPPGSQVLCHSRDSFSYIPPREDGCLYKFIYDLWAEDAGPASAPGDGFVGWDLRDSPPSWWPCDAQGELLADSGYIGPEELEVECSYEPGLQAARNPPPVGTRVRCEGSNELTFLREWMGPCEGERKMGLFGEIFNEQGDLSGSWSVGKPIWWPCDYEGNYIDNPYFPPL